MRKAGLVRRLRRLEPNYEQSAVQDRTTCTSEGWQVEGDRQFRSIFLFLRSVRDEPRDQIHWLAERFSLFGYNLRDGR